MTPLRKRMTEELQLRNLSPVTARIYLKVVERFAKHFHASPECLGSQEVREWLLYLINDRKVTTTTLQVHRAALRFLYSTTLKQSWFDGAIPLPKRGRFPLGQAELWVHGATSPAFSERSAVCSAPGRGGTFRALRSSACAPNVRTRRGVFFGVFTISNHVAATSEFTFRSWRSSKRLSGIENLLVVVRSSATSSGSREGVANLLPSQIRRIS